MKREKFIILGLITAISILAIALNKDMTFAVATGVGYIMMLALSFIKYEWIKKVRYWIIGVWIIAWIAMTFLPLDISINVFKRYMFLEILALLFLPVAATLLDDFKWKKVAWIVVGVFVANRLFSRPAVHWATFVSKKGDAAYIYDQIKRYASGSKFIGRSELAGDMTAYLPETKTGTILTAYGVEYGNIIKIVICVLLAAVIGKVLFDMFKNKSKGYLCAVGCMLAIGIESLVIVLQNILAIPYKSMATFLPFFSDGIGGLIVCYLMMGLVLCVYKEKVGKEESNN